MRILLVISGMHPRSGGPPAVVAGSAQALVEKGHSVTVLTTVLPGEKAIAKETWGEMLDAGVTLEFCAEEGLRGFLGLSREKPLISTLVSNADVVHLHGVWNSIFLIAARAAYRMQIPYFVSVHGVFDRRAINRIPQKQFKKRAAVALFGFRTFLKRAAGVVYGSKAEADQSWHISDDLKLAFIPNGVNASVGITEPTDDQLAKLYEVAPQVQGWKRTILCRSRIHEEKGIDMLVQAFNSLCQKYPDVNLLIAGIGQDAEYEQLLNKLIAAGPAPERIFLTTKLTGPGTQFLYKVGDIFAMPSIAEGFSVALVEGLAFGRPILLTRYCHMQIVEDTGGGVVADPNVDSITDALDKLLAKSDAELQEMGTTSRALFDREFSWDRVAEILCTSYDQAISDLNIR